MYGYGSVPISQGPRKFEDRFTKIRPQTIKFLAHTDQRSRSSAPGPHSFRASPTLTNDLKPSRHALRALLSPIRFDRRNQRRTTLLDFDFSSQNPNSISGIRIPMEFSWAFAHIRWLCLFLTIARSKTLKRDGNFLHFWETEAGVFELHFTVSNLKSGFESWGFVIWIDGISKMTWILLFLLPFDVFIWLRLGVSGHLADWFLWLVMVGFRN